MTIIKGLLICLLGLGAMLFGAKSAVYNSTLMAFGHQTLGKIVSFDELHSEGKRLYSAEAEFEVAGKTFKTTPENYVLKRRFRTHDYVLVTYLPHDPNYSKISSDIRVGHVAYLPMGVGALAMLFGAGLATGRVKRVDE